MRRRINALWNEFAVLCIPVEAPAEQKREMRRAFYAGVECVLSKLGSEVSEGDADDDPDDMRMMEEITQEMREFAVDLQEGRA
jgi:hypothetical protein